MVEIEVISKEEVAIRFFRFFIDTVCACHAGDAHELCMVQDVTDQLLIGYQSSTRRVEGGALDYHLVLRVGDFVSCVAPNDTSENSPF